MKRSALVPLALVGIFLAGCAGSPSDTQPSPTVSGGPTALAVSIDTGKRGFHFTLTCDPAGGDLPRADAACAALAKAASDGTDPFAPVPTDVACAELYGGPQTAEVSGTWNGQPVVASFSRTDSCQIKRWDDLADLFATKQ